MCVLEQVYWYCPSCHGPTYPVRWIYEVGKLERRSRLLCCWSPACPTAQQMMQVPPPECPEALSAPTMVKRYVLTCGRCELLRSREFRDNAPLRQRLELRWGLSTWVPTSWKPDGENRKLYRRLEKEDRECYEEYARWNGWYFGPNNPPEVTRKMQLRWWVRDTKMRLEIKYGWWFY
ncbi:hypothetical protein NKR19_g1725 [Coniochaeta hoffmannii]|uniref:Uncharacterized protein n=1 Tax=Coniochaeta hoffmannii TaxID=91930 RepID=A0AA38SJZ5_9PEZI|nr:hypothetical protein NKR19_g1725 [Coniochaeta hoffmannii]